jgi:hypothetical protein
MRTRPIALPVLKHQLAPEEETFVIATCQHYESDWDAAQSGWYVEANIQHRPTQEPLAKLQAGPFATRAQALGELAKLLTKITTAEAKRA